MSDSDSDVDVEVSTGAEIEQCSTTYKSFCLSKECMANYFVKKWENEKLILEKYLKQCDCKNTRVECHPHCVTLQNYKNHMSSKPLQ
jgi:hypothetical protein